MGRKRKTPDRRLTLVALFLFIGLLAVAGRLVVIQGLQAGRYQELAREQRGTSIDITSRRGTIFDREGEVLAISEDTATIYATPYQIREPKRAAREIAPVLGENPEGIADRLESKSGFVYIARKVDREKADRIKRMKLEGIGFLDESRRCYPFGSLASQIVGMVDIDNRGLSGLELYYENILGGKPGKVLLEKDAAGRPIPGSERRRVEAQDGTDIRLTIDKDVQICLEEQLGRAVDRYSAKAGTAVVMDCNTGEILAMGSVPTFNPNDREDISPAAMRNRAVTDVYEPGSALKVVTAAAALQEGLFDPGTVLSVPSQIQVADRVFKEATPKPARELTFTEVISQSSNVGAVMIGLKLGEERLSGYLERLGFGHLTGIDFPGEVEGLVPPSSEWYRTGTAAISIGQGISITPMQLVCAVACIANGGRRISPHLLEAEITNGGARDMGLGGVGEELLNRDTCEKMSGMMVKVVAPGGTGTRAAVRYYTVAGKTGTASKPRVGGEGYSGYMATFVGFAPAERPRFVAAVVLDEPRPIWGGETSAPVFKEIMEFTLQHLKVRPSRGFEEQGK